MKHTPRSATASRSGMTLIELLVVMAIIMVLVSLVVGISGIAQRNSAEAKAKAEIGQITLEIERFRGDRGELPGNLGEFMSWYHEKYGGTVFQMTEYTGSGANRVMIDPWGRPYQYERSGMIFLLGSRGPDGQWNTADDITNRNLN